MVVNISDKIGQLLHWGLIPIYMNPILYAMEHITKIKKTLFVIAINSVFPL